jgi:RNA polymerase sigma-70 factor (ECF subfamily)
MMAGADEPNDVNAPRVTARAKVPSGVADDTQRFTALYREHHALVHAFAARRAGPDLAQEIVAETFLVAWRRFDDIPTPAAPWLYRVALYEIANLRRREAKSFRLHHTLAQNHVGGTEHEPDGAGELARAVADAFETLSPRDQEILRLAAWDHLSAAEGAAVLGCSVSAYRMRLHRARSRLASKSGARELLRPQPRDMTETATALTRAITLVPAPMAGTELGL